MSSTFTAAICCHPKRPSAEGNRHPISAACADHVAVFAHALIRCNVNRLPILQHD